MTLDRAIVTLGLQCSGLMEIIQTVRLNCYFVFTMLMTERGNTDC